MGGYFGIHCRFWFPKCLNKVLENYYSKILIQTQLLFKVLFQTQLLLIQKQFLIICWTYNWLFEFCSPSMETARRARRINALKQTFKIVENILFDYFKDNIISRQISNKWNTLSKSRLYSSWVSKILFAIKKPPVKKWLFFIILMYLFV